MTFGDKQWGSVGVRAVLGFPWRGAAPVAAAGMGAGAPCPNPTRVGMSKGVMPAVLCPSLPFLKGTHACGTRWLLFFLSWKGKQYLPLLGKGTCAGQKLAA